MVKITRRNMMLGSLALPFLPSLPGIAKAASRTGSELRTVFLFTPNGIMMPAWTPQRAGDLTLSKTLSPLANVKDYATVLTGLKNGAAQPRGGGKATHDRSTGSFLSCTFIPTGVEKSNGISIDQVLARELGGRSRLRSIELGMKGTQTSGVCKSYSCSYRSAISWADKSTPMPKITSPLRLYQRLFPDSGGDEQVSRMVREERSIVDYVVEDLRLISGRVNAMDKQNLDAYLTSLREIERQLALLEEVGDNASCNLPGEPPNTSQFAQKAYLFADMMVLALACDQTRVASFMYDNGASYTTYPMVGVNQAHHVLAHMSTSNQAARDALQKVDEYYMTHVARMAEKMRDTRMPDGSSLLDKTLMYVSSELSEGGRHSTDNMPILLLGKGDGFVRPGRHLVYTKAQKLEVADVFLSLLRSAGIDAESFGDYGTQGIPDLV